MSTFSKTNIVLSALFLIVAFMAPTLIEKFNYSGKKFEVESVVKNMADNQSEYYSLNNQYISLKKSEQAFLTKRFKKIGKDDLNYYDYTVTTNINSFTIIAEPKSKFLQSREIFPQIYTYTHILKGKSSASWSNF